MKQSTSQRSQKLVKTAINKVINNISIFAIFIALGIILFCYAGLTFDISAKIVITVAVPSVVLALSSIIIYELWVKNGAQNAREEQTYIDLVSDYEKKSKDLNVDVMQEFIDAEKKRRYDVEEKRLDGEIEQTEKAIAHLDNKARLDRLRIRWAKRKLLKLHKLKDNIVVDMPYTYSEQLDQLRYNIDSIHCKEYKPNDTAMYMRSRRIHKYTFLICSTLIGFNAITPAVGGQHWAIAVFMTALSAITLLSSVITGFSHGYQSIAVSSTGVYKTALSFIDKADAYCNKYNKQLRYTKIVETNDIPNELKTETSIEPETSKETEQTNSQITMDIFDKLLK
jgi:hypothetical protein